MPIEVKQREAQYFKNSKKIEPAYVFIKNLKDPTARQKIRAKIRKAEKGNFGQEGEGYRHIRSEIWELKIHSGPGYRVYFAIEDDKIILLLTAGNKTTQQKDIEKAEEYWLEYKSKKED